MLIEIDTELAVNTKYVIGIKKMPDNGTEISMLSGSKYSRVEYRTDKSYAEVLAILKEAVWH